MDALFIILGVFLISFSFANGSSLINCDSNGNKTACAANGNNLIGSSGGLTLWSVNIFLVKKKFLHLQVLIIWANVELYVRTQMAVNTSPTMMKTATLAIGCVWCSAVVMRPILVKTVHQKNQVASSDVTGTMLEFSTTTSSRLSA